MKRKLAPMTQGKAALRAQGLGVCADSRKDYTQGLIIQVTKWNSIALAAIP